LLQDRTLGQLKDAIIAQLIKRKTAEDARKGSANDAASETLINEEETLVDEDGLDTEASTVG